MGNIGKAKKYIDLVKHMLCQVYTEENLQKMKMAIDYKDNFAKQYSCGGLTTPCGYYCPSLLREIIVTNSSRGRLLKKLTKTSHPDYCYYFDNDRLVLIQSNFSDVEESHRYKWVNREQGIEYYLELEDDEISEIIISRFEGEKIVNNTFLRRYHNDECFELVLEDYQYNHERKLTSAVRTTVSAFALAFYEDTYHFDFLYDLDGRLVKCIINGDDDEDSPVHIPPVVRTLITGEPEPARKKALTETELSKELKRIAKEWKGEDIYAISLFVNHDGDEVTDFAISCNHEEGQTGEERWNDTCWEQDEESLLHLLDGKETDWRKLLKLCAETVGRLQENQFFSKLFSRDIAVIIHGYEYEDEELEATRLANPGGQADEFFREMKKLGMIE